MTTIVVPANMGIWFEGRAYRSASVAHFAPHARVFHRPAPSPTSVTMSDPTQAYLQVEGRSIGKAAAALAETGLRRLAVSGAPAAACPPFLGLQGLILAPASFESDIDDQALARVPAPDVRVLSLPDASAIDFAGLAPASFGSALERLEVTNARGSDGLLAKLPGHSRLTELELSPMDGVTAAGLASLRALPALRSLRFFVRGRVLADPIAALPPLPLKRLSVDAPRGQSLDALPAKFADLEELGVGVNGVLGGEVGALVSLASLRTLQLTARRFKPGALGSLGGGRLRSLTLGADHPPDQRDLRECCAGLQSFEWLPDPDDDPPTRWDAAHFEALSASTTLRKVVIAEAPSDQDFNALMRLPDLAELDLPARRLTAAGFASARHVRLKTLRLFALQVRPPEILRLLESFPALERLELPRCRYLTANLLDELGACGRKVFGSSEEVPKFDREIVPGAS